MPPEPPSSTPLPSPPQLKLLNESLTGKFIRDEEYASVHKMDASTENDALRGADRSNAQVNARYEQALADLNAYEEEKKQEALRGESMTSYIDSINGDMWRDIDPADAWVSPRSMMQTREIAWHARKMTPIRDMIDKDGRVKKDVAPRARSKSVEERESDKRIAEIKKAQGVQDGVQAYYYMSNAGNIIFTVPREKETMETYAWARMSGDISASAHPSGLLTLGGWTLFRNADEQDKTGAGTEKESDALKARGKARKALSSASLSECEAKARFESSCAIAGGSEGNDKVDGYVSFDWAESHPSAKLARQGMAHTKYLSSGLSVGGISVQIPAEPIQVTPGHPVFLSGNRVSIKFHPEDKMWDLKLMIERKEGIPATRQQLVVVSKSNKVSEMHDSFLVKSYQSETLMLRVLPPAKPYRAPPGTLHRIPEPRWRCEGLEGLQSGGSGLIWVPRVTNKKDVMSTIVSTLDRERVLARLHEFGKKPRCSNKISDLRKDLVKLMQRNVDTTGMMMKSGGKETL